MVGNVIQRYLQIKYWLLSQNFVNIERPHQNLTKIVCFGGLFSEYGVLELG